MSGTGRVRLLSAVALLLQPLVRILLRNGISHREFSDVARKVYVDVAGRDFPDEAGRQSASRIAMLTGIHRKDVARLQRMPAPVMDAAPKHYNRAVRVVSGWTTDPRYVTARRKPRVLPVTGPVSFESLVSQYSGDIPYTTILDELLRAGSVERVGASRVRLLVAAYVPAGDRVELFQILGDDVSNLLGTIDHNLADPNPPFFQREVTHERFPVDDVETFRAMSHAEGQALLEQFNSWLRTTARSRDKGCARRRVGVGIYYFESDSRDNSS